MKEGEMKHFIYRVLCVPTGKYYTGMHSTDNMNDGYKGSGRLVTESIAQHGYENHWIQYVEYCDTRQELERRFQDHIKDDGTASED